MQTRTRNILIGAGALTAVVVGGVVFYKRRRTEPTLPPPPTGQGFVPPLSPRPPRGPGDITTLPGPTTGTFAVPSWSDAAEQAAQTIIEDAWAEAGGPSYDPETAVDLALVAALEIWPNWSWPTTAAQSESLLQSSALGSIVWDNLLAIAQNQLLSGLGLSAKRVGLGEAICAGEDFRLVPVIEIANMELPTTHHPSWGLYSWCVGQNLNESWDLPNGFYLVIWKLNGPKLVFGPFDDLLPVPQQGGRPSGRTSVEEAIVWIISRPYDSAVDDSLS